MQIRESMIDFFWNLVFLTIIITYNFCAFLQLLFILTYIAFQKVWLDSAKKNEVIFQLASSFMERVNFSVKVNFFKKYVSYFFLNRKLPPHWPSEKCRLESFLIAFFFEKKLYPSVNNNYIENFVFHVIYRTKFAVAFNIFL